MALKAANEVLNHLTRICLPESLENDIKNHQKDPKGTFVEGPEIKKSPEQQNQLKYLMISQTSLACLASIQDFNCRLQLFVATTRRFTGFDLGLKSLAT